AGVLSFVHGDADGSTRLVTDSDGQLAAALRYLAFGQELSGSAAPVTHLYHGQRLDPETGLYHMRARQYQPATGRFLAVDPFDGLVSDPVTRHPYQFARNNTLTYADPTGLLTTAEKLSVLKIQAGLGAALGGLVGFAGGISDPNDG